MSKENTVVVITKELDSQKEVVDLGIQPPAKHWSISRYIEAATSQNTRKAYRSDIAHYESAGGMLPASPGAIMNYLENHANKLSPRTLSRRLIAIRNWHVYQGFTDPTTHPSIQKTMQGILRTHGKPKDKARAITLEELTLIVNNLDNEGALRAIRDAALFQIGFFGALRRSEIVTIQFEHLSWNKSGLEIIIPQSKTDQLNEGQHCAIPYGNDQLCPIRSLKTWLEYSEIDSGPIFRRIFQNKNIGSDAITAHSVNAILKARAKEAGLGDIKNISCHSLRRGLATSAALAGAPLHAIMRAGRWKQTNTVIEYMEEADRFRENAADKVLQSIQKES